MPNITVYEKITVDPNSPGTINTSNSCSKCNESQYQTNTDTETNTSTTSTPPVSTTAAQQKCRLCKEIRDYIKDNSMQSAIATALTENAEDSYDTASLKYSKDMQSKMVNLNKTKSEITELKSKIAALKKRIELKHSILAAYPTKIKSTMHDLNSNIAQSKLSTQDKVVIGVPFLPPFFSVRTHKYVVSIILISVVILVLVALMCFTDLLGKRIIPKLG